MATALSVLQNIGLLCLGAVALLLLTRYLKLPVRGVRERLLFGLILGVISVVVIGVPIPGPMGSTFDTRAGPVVLAGYFAGPLGGLVAAVCAAVARYEIGGPAAISGILSVILYATTGMAFAAISRRIGRERQGVLGFLVLALAATIIGIPAFFIGRPPSVGLDVLLSFWPVLLVGNVVGVTLLGLTTEFLLQINAERNRYAVNLRTSAVARQAARIGVWTLDLSSGDVTWDPVQHELMGVARREFDGTHKSFMDRVLQEDRPRVEAVLQAAKAKGRPFEMRFRILRPDGNIRHIQGHGHFVGGHASGAPRRMIGVNFDVTREEELLTQVKLNSGALDSTVCGVLITEARGDHPIVYSNSAFTRITGYQAAEVLGRNCRFLTEGLDEQPELQTIRLALARGEPCTITLRNRRKNGELFWNTLRLAPIHDSTGDITHFVGVQDDVTEHVQAKQIIAEGRDQIKAILAAAPDAILSVDSQQRITSFNDAAVRLFGWTGEEIIGRSIQELVPVPIRKAHVELVRNYIADPDSAPGPMSALRIVRARRKDGGSFPALVSLARYQIGGEPMVTATAHDMTEIVEANDELVRLSDRLRDQLEEAYRANEAKDHFLAHMSHELRTPLNAIIGFADMLTTLGTDTLGPERTGEYVGDIKRSGEHLLSLINEILDLSRLSAGQLDASVEATDARTLVEEALTTMEPSFTDKSISVRAEVGEEATVLCDRRFTLQCLLNLLSNAAKFSPERSQVTARVFRSDDGVRFIVEDQGAGVPDDILERVGEPFLRKDDPLTSNGEGSGLGLAITKSLVEKQDGRLEIASGPQGGTVAAIWLPSPKHVPAPADTPVAVC